MPRAALCCSCLVLLTACAEQPAAAAAADGALVLELGGNGDSLAATLQRAGVELLPPREPKVAPPAEPGAGDGSKPAGDGTKPPGGEPAPVPEPPPVTTQEIVVKPGQTVMAISLEYLGTTRRYREILALNHLDEDKARRIKGGDRLLVPKPAARK